MRIKSWPAAKLINFLRLNKRYAPYAGLAAAGASAVLALIAFLGWLGPQAAANPENGCRAADDLPALLKAIACPGRSQASGQPSAPPTKPADSGPKVTSLNIGNRQVPVNANIVLGLDSAIASGQDPGTLIQIKSGSRPIPAAVTARDSRVTINPDSDLPACSRFTIQIAERLQDKRGGAGTGWHRDFRTACQTNFSIGQSAEGRAIAAHRFGNGSENIVYIGGTHGDESSSVSVLESWINYLDKNPGTVPPNRSLTIIPNANPDGSAAGTRTNSNGVDLNRNFPAKDWKPDVTMPDGRRSQNGGGSEPLSEPESKALANYITSIKLRLALTHHAAAGVVIPNDAGDSDAQARAYSQRSGLNYEPHNRTDNIFGYDTTGAMEEWLREEHDIPTLLIEHRTHSENEFRSNLNALRRTATMP